MTGTAAATIALRAFCMKIPFLDVCKQLQNEDDHDQQTAIATRALMSPLSITPPLNDPGAMQVIDVIRI
jgi:hypothetical protein